MRYFDELAEEALGRGGTFDITGTAEVDDIYAWGFNAEDGTVIETLEGIPVGEAEVAVNVLGMLVTSAAAGLLGNCIYRVPGYIITKVKLTSGSLHCFKTVRQ